MTNTMDKIEFVLEDEDRLKILKILRHKADLEAIDVAEELNNSDWYTVKLLSSLDALALVDHVYYKHKSSTYRISATGLRILELIDRVEADRQKNEKYWRNL